MPTVKRIKKGDTVKVISGANKGTTAKVLSVLTAKNAVVLEGIGQKHRHVKASQRARCSSSLLRQQRLPSPLPSQRR